jgi:3-oxoacyl-[acyl-carrier protein] reductase
MRLNDKVAIITGSSRGIGAAIARAFVREGAHVVLNGRTTSAARLRPLAGELSRQGVDVLTVKGDVGRAATVRRLVSRTLDRSGRIDILVNNAGVSPMAPIERISARDWDEVMRVNLKSAFLCSQAVFPYMKAQKAGVILNISSGSAKSGGVGAHYAASKGGMNTFTRSLAFEGAPFGVRANAIAPGPIETDMANHLFDDRRRRFLLSVIPVARLGTPEDVAEAAVFLCSGEASFTTGETLELDGGLNFHKPLSYAGAGDQKED